MYYGMIMLLIISVINASEHQPHYITLHSPLKDLFNQYKVIIPESSGGAFVNGNEVLDLNTIETISNHTFQECIDEESKQGKPFFLVATISCMNIDNDKTVLVRNYYNASLYYEYLFGNKYNNFFVVGSDHSTIIDLVELSKFRDCLNKSKLLSLEHFIIEAYTAQEVRKTQVLSFGTFDILRKQFDNMLQGNIGLKTLDHGFFLLALKGNKRALSELYRALALRYITHNDDWYYRKYCIKRALRETSVETIQQRLLVDLGLLYQEQGLSGKAIRSIRNALLINTNPIDNYNPLFFYCKMLAHNGLGNQAINVALRYYKNDDTYYHKSICSLLSGLYLQKGDAQLSAYYAYKILRTPDCDSNDERLKFFERCMKQASYYNLAIIHQCWEYYNEAQFYYQRAIDENADPSTTTKAWYGIHELLRYRIQHSKTKALEQSQQ